MSDNEKTSKADAFEKTGRLIFLTVLHAKKDKYFRINKELSSNYNWIQYHLSVHNEQANGKNLICFK